MKRLALVVIMLILLSLPSAAQASPPTQEIVTTSYYRIMPDQRFVFIMVGDLDCCPQIDKKIKDYYPASGLYPNDGTLKPLWTVDHYSYRSETFLSDDGNLLAAIIDAEYTGEEAKLAFYKQGKLQKSYSLDGLVRAAEVHQRPYLAPVKYIWYKTLELDTTGSHLNFEGSTGEKYIFDLASGEILEGNYHPIKQETAILWLIGGGTILVLGFVLVKYLRRKRAAKTA